MGARKHPAEMRIGQMLEELLGKSPSHRRADVVRYLRLEIEADNRRAHRLEAVARAAMMLQEDSRETNWNVMREAISKLEPGDVTKNPPLPEWLRAPGQVQEG